MLLTDSMIFSLNEEEIGVDGNICPGKMLHLFQDIAGKHAEKFGMGFDDLIENNLIWVVTRIRFCTYGAFEANKSYKLVTYPLPKQSLLYLRDYYIYDENDNLLVKGSSQWCILDFVSRKIQRTTLDYDGEFYETKAFDDGFPKLKINGELPEIGSHKIDGKDLDNNAHTNNCRYAEMVEEFSDVKKYNEFNITFQKETRLGDVILFYKEKVDDGEIVAGKLEDSSVVFTAKLSYNQ